MVLLTLEGTVEDIIFRNEVNAYTVASLSTSDGNATIVGYIPYINIGETIKVEGEWIYHPTYGEQLEISNVSIVVPSTINGIEKYLSSGMIPHIGPKTAKKIVERFGKDALDIIQYNPERLKEIEGIGEKKLKRIVEAFEEQGELREIMVFLQQYGITANYGIRIYKKYGKDTVNIISENPYKLSEDIFGIGFKTADKIAQNMGISLESPYRIEGGIRYVINRYAGSGHTYVPKDELLPSTSELLGVDSNLVEESLRDLAIKGIVHILNIEDEMKVYYTPFHIAENNVSRKIVELSRVELEDFNVDIDKIIKEIEGEEGIDFADKQIEAIKESIKNGIVVITGGPGTGKTTIINAIIKIFEDQSLTVNLAAPTGRAAKRMTETTGIEAKTIHRLLEYSYMEEEMAFGLNEDSPLDTDLLIIDEASMVDILLMNSLLKAIVPGTRLILVGDVDQLPSVGPGNVLKDIMGSGVVKVVKLDEIFRQAEESLIVVNAHRINKGEMPILNEKDKDFYFIKERDPNNIVNIILSLCKERLPNYYGVDPLKDIQVLTPMKKGDVGINALNKYLQKVLNPKAYGKKEKLIGDQLFRVGDKVMQIKNNYTTEWELIKDEVVVEKGEGVFNGDFGIIVDIDDEDRIIKVLFDDEKEVEYNFNQLDELKLSYATTVHKSQGSEFPVVVMPIYWGPPMLLTRNLLYTAITRAKNLVVLVGEERYLRTMISNNRIAKRYSSLDYKIRNILTSF
ncbi:SF1B family DNA helicase RecD2 [Clostridium sp. Cult1]|jgi:exodeoxyribonuclease V alpha subunit|uniref:SF1B family DNA helicase RecD2 n=1 Tax=Clostridium sp. Cult1 TaxID=2079002 RepID=UPI001F02FD39|nr:ATP-dependent RecD-like DNA helicase [Clostridium sp. Cult1]